MSRLSDDMIRLVERQRLGFVATVCSDGTPNLSPKGTLCVLDGDHLAFADIRSPGTIANLRHNPAVEVNVVDPLVRKGYRFKGKGEIIEYGLEFERLVGFFTGRGFSDAPKHIRVVVVIHVERAAPVISPGYDRGLDEVAMRERWTRHYLGEVEAV